MVGMSHQIASVKSHQQYYGGNVPPDSQCEVTLAVYGGNVPPDSQCEGTPAVLWWDYPKGWKSYSIWWRIPTRIFGLNSWQHVIL